MYLVKQSCIILINSIANCAKENIFSKQKKFMHRAVPPQNNSCTGNGPKKKILAG